MKSGFVPISIERMVAIDLEHNTHIDREEHTRLMQAALMAHKARYKCRCGTPIWVAGSPIMRSLLCFTCITGEAMPDGDYEIDEAM